MVTMALSSGDSSAEVSVVRISSLARKSSFPSVNVSLINVTLISNSRVSSENVKSVFTGT